MQTTTLPTKTSPQAPASSWTPDRAATLVADRAASTIVRYDTRVVLQRAMTPAEKDLLKHRLATVRKTLLPANGETDLKRIGRALSAALMGYARADTDKLVRDYTRLLSALPAWAIEQACDDIRRGGASGMDPNFPPSAPAIHKLADEKLIGAKAERDKLTLLLTAPVEQAKPKLDEGAAERVAVSLQKFHERMATPNPQECEQRKAEREETERKRADHAEHSRRMDYNRQGFEPPTNQHGITKSISLARAVGMQLKHRAPAPPPRHDFSPSDLGNEVTGAGGQSSTHPPVLARIFRPGAGGA